MTCTVRPARPGEAAALSALCWRSKRHWNYDDAFMAQCRASLDVGVEAIGLGRVWVGVDAADRPLGVVELAPTGEDVDLDKLFVEPMAIGSGVGQTLFRHAVALARAGGGRRLTILADPHAAAFYERMGSRFEMMAPSDAIPGRELPLYVYRLTPTG